MILHDIYKWLRELSIHIMLQSHDLCKNEHLGKGVIYCPDVSKRHCFHSEDLLLFGLIVLSVTIDENRILYNNIFVPHKEERRIN